MTRYLLDTDHISLHEYGHVAVRRRLAQQPAGSVATSAITVEEVLRGRVAVFGRRLDGAARVRAYAKLLETVEFFQSIPLVAFDPACEARFQDLLRQKLRVGNQDLKIGATAMTNGLILVTRNRKDFSKIPGLTLEDWS